MAETPSKSVTVSFRALEVHQWQVAHIRTGIQQAADGNLVSEEEAEKFFEEILR